MTTAYELLGVRPDVDYEAIRTAYLDAAKLYHPDIASDDSTAEARFKRINAAHDILKNTSRRAAYDAHLRQMRRQLRRQWSKTIAVYAGCCLLSVTITIGGFHLLRPTPSRPLSPVTPADPPFAAAQQTTSSAGGRTPDQLGGGRENRRDTASASLGV
jgi:curved DNA-binding protein CbpA